MLEKVPSYLIDNDVWFLPDYCDNVTWYNPNSKEDVERVLVMIRKSNEVSNSSNVT